MSGVGNSSSSTRRVAAGPQVQACVSVRTSGRSVRLRRSDSAAAIGWPSIVFTCCRLLFTICAPDATQRIAIWVPGMMGYD